MASQCTHMSHCQNISDLFISKLEILHVASSELCAFVSANSSQSCYQYICVIVFGNVVMHTYCTFALTSPCEKSHNVSVQCFVWQASTTLKEYFCVIISARCKSEGDHVFRSVRGFICPVNLRHH